VTRKVRNRVAFSAAVLALGLLAASHLEAQFRRGFNRSFSNARFARPEDYDGTFQFCRVVFNNGPDGDPNSGNWEVDYPRADINLSVRLAELTKTRIGHNSLGDPTNVVIRLTSPEMFNCPFIMMTEVGAADLSAKEVASLREYLLKGGFLFVSDYHGTYAKAQFDEEIRRVLPEAQYPTIDLTPPNHPMWHTMFNVSRIPQIASIQTWRRTGGSTIERWNDDGAPPDASGIADDHGRLMVVMVHNSDIPDPWEREGEDTEYFYRFSPDAYAIGIDIVLYAMTH